MMIWSESHLSCRVGFHGGPMLGDRLRAWRRRTFPVKALTRGGIVSRRAVPTPLYAVCGNCLHCVDVQAHEGIEVLDRTCSACEAKAWSVRPRDHQQSRKA